MSELLRAIQQSLVEGLWDARQSERVGGFAYLRHPSDPLLWLNQSVPVGLCTAADVVALVRRYRETDRSPWIEYFADVNPELGTLLEEGGLALQHRMPIMALPPELWREAAFADRARVPRKEDLEPGLRAAGEAFGGPMPSGVDELAASLGSGRVLAAVGYEGEEIVAMGQAIGGPAVREVCGIATRPAWRRRGYGKAVVDCLLEQFFTAGGELAWLTAGDDGAKAVYEKSGFEEIGTQLTYGLPDGAS